MLALGRGQRELILGDRATGKTTLATDAMIHQRDSDVVSIYVGVGQKSSSLRQVIDAVQEHGAPERTSLLSLRRPPRPACNGSLRLPASPSRVLSATAAPRSS
jgi:F0F1-type ATP synthase alpha subunit